MMEDEPILPEVEGGRDFDDELEERHLVAALYNEKVTVASGLSNVPASVTYSQPSERTNPFHMATHRILVSEYSAQQKLQFEGWF
jgi:hypothetical protein